MRHIIPISGKDSLATAIVQKTYDPSLSYEYIFNVTGWELPPVYDWLDKVSDKLGITIKIIGASLDQIIEEQGILPSQRMRFCTRLAKICPMQNFFGDDQVVVYYGLRADEPYRDGYSSNGKIIPTYPLRDFRLGLPQVWAINESNGLTPPFFRWPEIEDGVKARMGNDIFLATVSRLSPWDYQSLFSWKWRQFNCAVCIYGRQYEIIGLHQFYPDVFERIAKIEAEIGADGFNFRTTSMRDIVKRKDEIIEKRIDQIVKTLYKLLQVNMFDDYQNTIEQTSCGLFCGK